MEIRVCHLVFFPENNSNLLCCVTALCVSYFSICFSLLTNLGIREYSQHCVSKVMNFGENPTFDVILSLGSGTDYHVLDNFLKLDLVD